MTSTQTGGRTPRSVVTLMMAIIAAGFVFLFLLEERPADPSQIQGVGGFVTTQLLSQAIGGAIIGALMAGLFGRPGLVGWVVGLIAGAVATLLAGVLGGVIYNLPGLLAQGLDLQNMIQIGVNAFIVPLAAAGKPLVGAMWVGALALTHVLAMLARAGRV